MLFITAISLSSPEQHCLVDDLTIFCEIGKVAVGIAHFQEDKEMRVEVGGRVNQPALAVLDSRL